MTDYNNIEMRKYDDTFYTIPDGAANENFQDKRSTFRCMNHNKFSAQSDGAYAPVENRQINIKVKQIEDKS